MNTNIILKIIEILEQNKVVTFYVNNFISICLLVIASLLILLVYTNKQEEKKRKEAIRRRKQAIRRKQQKEFESALYKAQFRRMYANILEV